MRAAPRMDGRERVAYHDGDSREWATQRSKASGGRGGTPLSLLLGGTWPNLGRKRGHMGGDRGPQEWERA